MIILHISECAGGVERYLQMLLPRLEAQGFQQAFICSKNYEAEKYCNLVDKVYQLDLKQSFNPSHIIKQVRDIRTIIHEVKPDVVYCHSSFAGGLGRLAAFGLGCEIVYNPHGWAFNINGAKSFFYLLIEYALTPMTDKIVCISEAEYNSALQKHIANEKKLSLIRNGIDVEAVRCAQTKSRSELGISEDAFVVGMVGRLSAQKAPDVFVQSAKLIHEKIPNSAFIIVGNGEEVDYVRTYAKENELQLIVTGWTDEPYSYLKIFDVAMLLSRWEGFGLAIVEYMAAEKSVVATKVDAIPTLIEDGVDGLLVEVDNPRDAADKVFWIHLHPEEAKEMRRKALRKIIGNYNINRVTKQHVRMFNNLITKRIDAMGGGKNNPVYYVKQQYSCCA